MNTQRKLLIAALVVALAAPAIALAEHRPGHEGGGGSGGGGASTVTIDATTPIVWGRSTTISGRLRGANNNGRLIELQVDPFPYSDDDWQTAASATTDGQGDYRFIARPRESVRYRVLARAATADVLSGPVTVVVRLRVSLRVGDTTPRAGARVRFRGGVCPEHDGATAFIQRRSASGRFRAVARTPLTDAGDVCSGYSRRVRVRRDGVYRVRVPSGDDNHAPGRSRAIRFNVSP